MSGDYSENVALFSKPQSTYTGHQGAPEQEDAQYQGYRKQSGQGRFPRGAPPPVPPREGLQKRQSSRDSMTSRDMPPSSREMPPSSRDLPPNSRDLPPSSRDMPPSSRDLPPSSRDLPPSSRDLPRQSSRDSVQRQGSRDRVQRQSSREREGGMKRQSSQEREGGVQRQGSRERRGDVKRQGSKGSRGTRSQHSGSRSGSRGGSRDTEGAGRPPEHGGPRPSPGSIFRGGRTNQSTTGYQQMENDYTEDSNLVQNSRDVPPPSSFTSADSRGGGGGGGGGGERPPKVIEAATATAGGGGGDQPPERRGMDIDEVEETPPLFDEVLGTVHEKALSAAGFGRLQWTLFVVLGLGIMGDGIELMVIAYILPGAERELCMNEQMKGWLGKSLCH